MRESRSEMKGMFAKGQHGFDQTAVKLSPTTEQDQPMLDHGQQKFSKDLGQDLPRLLSAPGIYDKRLFPKLEQGFNLPTQTQQHEGLGRG